MIILYSGAITISNVFLKKGRKKKNQYTQFKCGSCTPEINYNMSKNKVTSVFQYFKVFLQDFCDLLCDYKFPDAPIATMRERKCQSFMENC